MEQLDQATCILSFEQSPSPNYRRAVHLAQGVSGYRCQPDGGRERHIVPITAATLAPAEGLLRLVSGWRGTSVELDGVALYEAEVHRLLRMLGCHRRQQRSGLGELYCWGLPERKRGQLPCRLVEQALPWNPDDAYRDPERLPGLLRALANDTFASLCPAYDAAQVERAAASWGKRPAGSRQDLLERLLGDVQIDGLNSPGEGPVG